jgi:hypothetical protein
MAMLDPAKLRRFLRKLEKLYKRNAYHSSTHAADVVHAVYMILVKVCLYACVSVAYDAE